MITVANSGAELPAAINVAPATSALNFISINEYLHYRCVTAVQRLRDKRKSLLRIICNMTLNVTPHCYTKDKLTINLLDQLDLPSQIRSSEETK